MAELAGRTPRRAELALALLKRILRSAEARGQVVDAAVFHLRVARPEVREPRFLTWAEAEGVRSWIPAQGGRRTRTKTSTGRRTIDVGPAAVKLFREQQLARPERRRPPRPPPEQASPNEAHNFMNRVFKPAARAAGIPELTFHDLRHTGASLMIAAGCNVKAIAEQMGHADGGGLVRTPPLRTPLQGRAPASCNRARIARFQRVV